MSYDLDGTIIEVKRDGNAVALTITAKPAEDGDDQEACENVRLIEAAARNKALVDCIKKALRANGYKPNASFKTNDDTLNISFTAFPLGGAAEEQVAVAASVTEPLITGLLGRIHAVIAEEKQRVGEVEFRTAVWQVERTIPDARRAKDTSAPEIAAKPASFARAEEVREVAVAQPRPLKPEQVRGAIAGVIWNDFSTERLSEVLDTVMQSIMAANAQPFSNFGHSVIDCDQNLPVTLQQHFFGNSVIDCTQSAPVSLKDDQPALPESAPIIVSGAPLKAAIVSGMADAFPLEETRNRLADVMVGRINRVREKQAAAHL